MSEQKSQNKWLLIASGVSIVLIAIAAVVLVLKLRGGGETPQWTIYTSPEGKYKAFFCGKIQAIDSAAGDVVNHTVTSNTGNGLGMGVTWADYPKNTFASVPPEIMIDAMAQVARGGGMLTEHNKGVLNGLPFAEIAYTSDVDGSHNRNFVTVKGLRIYTVFAHDTRNDPEHHDVSQFMSSFTIIE
jgi:hypothetical protein